MSSGVQPRRIVIVSGAPASGKTTVARPLAGALGLPLLSKDDIKEPLFAALGGNPDDEEYSHRLSRAAMEVLWSVAAHCPAAVLEANFRPHSEHERARVTELRDRCNGRMVEVFCRIPLEEAKRRFEERARSHREHPNAHAIGEIGLEDLRKHDEPFHLCPVIEVDTRMPADIPALVREVEKGWR